MDAAWRRTISGLFATQAAICDGAPTCQAILTGCAAEIVSGSALDPIMRGWTNTDAGAAMALRVLGAIHRLVLDGRAPELAALFPSVGGAADPPQAWPRAKAVLAAHADFVRSYLAGPPQTNEVGRSATLLGGFLMVAKTTGLPLRLLEIGTSAGLNLYWDRFHYATPSFQWGDPQSPVKLTFDWQGPPPPLDAKVTIASRQGCDLAPVDIRVAENVRLLESYVWTDQVYRMERLRAAISIAQSGDAQIEKESADRWLARRLAEPAQGTATVIYHSVVWPYLSNDMRQRIETAIADAGAAATADAPLAWLQLERWNSDATRQVILTRWPGGEERTVAAAQFHGAFVHWSCE
jgi:hypothetical protein